MISLFIRYSLAFFFVTLFQVLVLNNLHLSIYINPYAYILFILILPFDTPGWLLLSLAFIMGLIMDMYSDSMGMHSAAIVLVAFVRPYLLGLIAPRDGYEGGKTPHYGQMGMVWFLSYAGILTLLHHTALFIFEDFDLSSLFSVITRALLSSILSLIIMTVLLLISYKPVR